jgi:hypothetical protein
MPSTPVERERSSFDYSCNLCGGRGALPTTDHQDDPPGFTLSEQPAVCDACAPRWVDSTREFRRKVRQRFGAEEPIERDPLVSHAVLGTICGWFKERDEYRVFGQYTGGPLNISPGWVDLRDAAIRLRRYADAPFASVPLDRVAAADVLGDRLVLGFFGGDCLELIAETSADPDAGGLRERVWRSAQADVVPERGA